MFLFATCLETFIFDNIDNNNLQVLQYNSFLVLLKQKSFFGGGSEAPPSASACPFVNGSD